MEETEKKAWSKIILGSIAGLAGIAGIFFGRTLKQRTIRLSAFGVSIVSLLCAGYLLISGVEDLGVGVAGQYQLGGPAVQTLTFPGPNFFEMALQKTPKNVRRLKFQCPDGSRKFTVYFTPLGIAGIPGKSVVCNDGFKLLDYDSSKGFVFTP